MSINKIELSEAIIAELYSNKLIADAEIRKNFVENSNSFAAIPDQKNENENNFKFLGNNSKQILIALQYNDISYLPDYDLKFLSGILSACKLSLNDVAIINIKNHAEANYKIVTDQLKSKIVLLFDITPDAFGLPLNFPAFQLQAFDGATYLYAPSLMQIENDKALKTKLWTSLKRLFNI
jgi:hypothetical protein